LSSISWWIFCDVWVECVRTCVWGLVQITLRRWWKWSGWRVHIGSKACVSTQNYMFDSPPPVYVNWMQIGILVNPLQDALESLTWLTHSHQTYRSRVIYKIKLCQLLSCTTEKKEWLTIILGIILTSNNVILCLQSFYIYRETYILLVKRNNYFEEFLHK